MVPSIIRLPGIQLQAAAASRSQDPVFLERVGARHAVLLDLLADEVLGTGLFEGLLDHDVLVFLRDHDDAVEGMTNVAMLFEQRALEERRGDMMPHVVEWMAKHAAETLSITEIAEQCNMSRRSLERYFMEKTGESPARYRTHCRIERVKALLLDSETDLAEIATRCGFYDQSHFTRVFSKEAGVTPCRWRDGGGG